MRPTLDFEDADPQTARAYVELFRRVGDRFDYFVDKTPSNGPPSDGEEYTELRADLIIEDFDYDGVTTVSITAINDSDNFRSVVKTLKKIGFTILETNTEHEEDESIGEYRSDTCVARIKGDVEADWNVPHLIIYGSLYQPIEECVIAAVGSGCKVADVRNHYVVWGDGLTLEMREAISDAIRRSHAFSEERKEDLRSDVHRASYV